MSHFARLLLGLILLMLSCQPQVDPSQTKDPGEGFALHSDFMLERVASEPLVLDPVELHFTPDGTAYVLEMPGYPLRDEASRLVRLTDTDRDGRYDQRELFADSLGVASSFLPFRKGFLVAAPPELIWIADTDGDGRADQREVVLKGFSDGNLQHNVNGLTYGLDNRIYLANGGNSGAPYFPGRPADSVPLRGGDLRLDWQQDRLERFGESSGGFKLTLDAWGHVFETHNLEHNLHLVFEDRYLEQVPGLPQHSLVNISDHDSDGLARIYPIGEQQTRVNHPEQSGFFSGACGITYYGGGVFPEGFEPGLFVADVVLNLVHFDRVRDTVSYFATSRYGRREEFLASEDRAFRPVNFQVAPDGSLFVVDMYREVIEHPEWIPDELEKDLDLLAGRDKGRIYRVSPITTGTPLPGWDLSTMPGRLAALGHPNQWIRITAQRLLVTEAPHPEAGQISPLLRDANPLKRLHAMWTLEGVGGLGNEPLIDLLADDAAGIRENALRIAEGRLTDTEVAAAILSRLSDPAPRVRLQALLALSTAEDSVYRGFHADLSNGVSTLLNSAPDAWTLRAATAALHKQAAPFLLAHMEKWERTPAWSRLLADLTEGVFVRSNPQTLTQVLERMSAIRSKAPALAEMLRSASRGMVSRSEKDFAFGQQQAWSRLLDRFGRTEDRRVLLALAELREGFGLEPSGSLLALLPDALKQPMNSSLGLQERLEWLQLASYAPFGAREPIFRDLLASRTPIKLQREVLTQLWDSREAGVPAILLDKWAQLGPEARRHASDILLYQNAYHEALLTAMEQGKVTLGEFNLDLERRRELLFSEDAGIRRRAENLFSDAGVVQRKEVVAAFREALAHSGDPEPGREIFESRCASCHQLGGSGVAVGPNLSEIGRKSRQTLLHDILDPNAAVDTRFLSYVVTTRDGDRWAGVVLGETDSEIRLVSMGGEERTFQKGQLTEIRSTGTSFMPEGLEDGMTPVEMADLLAFLQLAR